MESDKISLQNCFQYDVASGSTFCRISTNGKLCKQKITNNHLGNKIRQLEKKHPNIFARVELVAKKKRTVLSDDSKITVFLSAEKLFDGLVELVSKNGRPFCITEDSGMRVIIDPILNGLFENSGERITVNESVIKEKLREKYEQVKSEIHAEITKKPIAVMLDLATKHNRSILGVNIRYHSSNGFVTRTIAMEPLTNSHTAQNIHHVLRQSLDDFGIVPIQIFAYVTDNAGNVVNVCFWMNRHCENFLMDQDYELDENMFASLNSDYFGNLLENIEPILGNEFISHIPCAVHTEQLAIHDAMKMTEFNEVNLFAKEIVKEQRLQICCAVGI